MNTKAKLAFAGSLILAVVLVLGMAVAAPKWKASGGGNAKECNDGLDNDGDGLVDLADTGCDNRGDNDESNCGDNVCEGGETASTCASDCVVCGNNIIEGSETCDGTALNNQTCQDFGFDGGTLGCQSSCGAYDTSGCYVNSCSDSDGGVNPWTAGVTTVTFEGANNTYDDTCADATLLIEYSCSGTSLYATNITCDSSMNSTGCSAGACALISG